MRRERTGIEKSLPRHKHLTTDFNVEILPGQALLALKNIWAAIQIDKRNRTASSRLKNDSADARFKVQDWVNAAMGCMKGFGHGKNGKCGYGRKIVQYRQT